MACRINQGQLPNVVAVAFNKPLRPGEQPVRGEALWQNCLQLPSS
jgi:hypothetical protein